jgi:hypothetical protein
MERTMAIEFEFWQMLPVACSQGYAQIRSITGPPLSPELLELESPNKGTDNESPDLTKFG